MDKRKKISGFSKLTKKRKLKWVADNYLENSEKAIQELASFWHNDDNYQKILDGFSENTISNFPLPFSVAPNFLINDQLYCVPMVIEESSVVAAASSSAKYWMSRGGFKTEVIDNLKTGQIHLNYNGDTSDIERVFSETKDDILRDLKPIVSNMENRGGGIVSTRLKTFHDPPGYCQIQMEFKTCDSMGANFINTVLEEFAHRFQQTCNQTPAHKNKLEVVMCILSNYTPDCIVRSEVSCKIEELATIGMRMTSAEFASKFEQAVKIAHLDPFRAATHNKGIFNGIDAVVVATGNDYRAVEANGHAYAARNGQYRSLSHCTVTNGRFEFKLEIPMTIGTIGGLTQSHPIAKKSLEILGNPSAERLMEIIASVGLAQNFAALKSLITTGIQKGHMRMHLTNVLNQLQATEREFKAAIEHFSHELVSFSSVRDFLEKMRRINPTTPIKSRTKKKS